MESMRRQFLSYCATSATHCTGAQTSFADLNSLLCLSWQSEQDMLESVMSLPDLVFHLGTNASQVETLSRDGNSLNPSIDTGTTQLVVKPNRYLFQLPQGNTRGDRRVKRYVSSICPYLLSI
jgi:hypothetical protein